MKNAVFRLSDGTAAGPCLALAITQVAKRGCCTTRGTKRRRRRIVLHTREHTTPRVAPRQQELGNVTENLHCSQCSHFYISQ